MAIFNMISGGGGEFETVYKGTVMPSSSNNKYLYLPTPVNNYKVGDFIYIQSKTVITDASYVYGVYLYVTYASTSTTGTGSSATQAPGTIRLGSSEGVTALGYLSSYNNNPIIFYYAGNPDGSCIYVSYGNYGFKPNTEYDFLVFRRTA